MNTFKNSIIALLAGLLVLTLSTQNSQGLVTTYDAVKLAEYQACVNATADFYVNDRGPGNEETVPRFIASCNLIKPKKQ